MCATGGFNKVTEFLHVANCFIRLSDKFVRVDQQLLANRAVSGIVPLRFFDAVQMESQGKACDHGCEAQTCQNKNEFASGPVQFTVLRDIES
jgi:hypothetical protein